MLAVGLKAYLGWVETTRWLDAAAGPCNRFGDTVDIVVLPAAPLLPSAVEVGRRSRFQVGAQLVSDRPPGAFTGELPASLLAELGVTHAEIGHAERRFLFGETPAEVRAKVVACHEAGLTPLLCVGEGSLGDTQPVAIDEAAGRTVEQLTDVLTVCSPDASLLVAYEPVWAIGADRPASADHVLAVADAIRSELTGYPAARLIYGGTAGPGVFADLCSGLDGLFLGRRAHDPAAFATALAEVATG